MKVEMPHSGAPSSSIKNITVVIPFSVSHHFDKTYESGDTL
jgi:hypothetical protein